MSPPSEARTLRAVFFDAVDTLIHPVPPALEVYSVIGAKFGHFLNAEIIRRRFWQAFQLQDQEDLRNNWATSEEREVRRWREIVSHVFDDRSDELFRTLWQHFAESAAWALRPDTCPLLAQLSQRKLTLGLASNFDRRLHIVAAGFPELVPLRLQLTSSEIGWRKPSPRFFDALVQAAKCDPQQILYVGDDSANDYVGAVAAGLQAFLLDANVSLRELLATI